MFSSQALNRDAFRCVVTGCVDYECYEKATPEQRQSYDLNAPDLVLSKTNYCHIFSPLNWNSVDDDLTNKKVKSFLDSRSFYAAPFLTFGDLSAKPVLVGLGYYPKFWIRRPCRQPERANDP